MVCISLRRRRNADCYHTVLKEAIEGNTTRHRATAEYLRSVGAREHSLHGAVQDGNVDMIRDISLAHPDCVNKPLSETFRQDPFAFAVTRYMFLTLSSEVTEETILCTLLLLMVLWKWFSCCCTLGQMPTFKAGDTNMTITRFVLT